MSEKDKVLAFPGGQEQKDALLAEYALHKAQDTLVAGRYWDGRAGCHIGCIMKGADHLGYAERYGLSPEIPYLLDVIFEGLPLEQRLEWPTRSTQAIQVGADTSLVWPKVVAWAMLEGDGALIKLFDQVDVAKLSEDDAKTFAEGRAAFVEIANMYQQWGETGIEPSPNDLDLALDRALGALGALALGALGALARALDRALGALGAIDLALDRALGALGARALDRARGASWVEVGDKLVELLAAAPVPVQAVA